MTDTAETQNTSKTLLGFWIYLMTDCIVFASLFATYIVLQTGTNGGLGAKELFSLPFILTATMLLLASSYTCGLAMLSAHRNQKTHTILWLGATFILGAGFLGMELSEFSALVAEGNSWRFSGFLSAFFTLVGVHGLHIFAGLIWISVLIIYILRRGLTEISLKRLALFSLFWHFLDVIWIFIFTVVYLIGVSR